MATVKMFFGIFVILAAVYISYLLIPPYFNNYQFRDWMKDEATRDSYSTKTEAEIRQDVIKKGREYDIPLTEQTVQVQRSGLQYNGTVIIHAPYVVHVDIPFFPMDLHFDASTENRGVL